MKNKGKITIFILLCFFMIIYIAGATWYQTLNNGLLAYFYFNETTGTNARDFVSGTYNGSIRGNPVLGGQGIINGSYALDGTGDYVNLTKPTYACAVDKNCSVFMWVNSTTSASDVLYWFGNSTLTSYVALRAESTLLLFQGENSDGTLQQVSTVSNIATGQFTHVGFVMNGTSVILYVNGTQVNQSIYTNNLLSRVGNIGNFEMIGASAATEPSDLYTGSIDEVGIWNRTLFTTEIVEIYNRGLGAAYDNNGTIALINVTLELPIASHSSSNQSLVFTAKSNTTTGTTLTNTTLWVWYQNGSVYNKTQFSTLSGTAQSKNLTINPVGLGAYLWNFETCVTNLTRGICAVSSSNRSFTIGGLNTSSSFNSSVYETESQSYFEYVSVPVGSTITAVDFIWNGSTRTSSYSAISATNYSLSSTFDIPLLSNPGLTRFSWNVTFSNGFEQEVSSYSQGAIPINLSQCGASPQNIPYLNFSFKDETNGNRMDAFLDTSIWEYYLGSGTVKKPLTYSSPSTSMFSYAFCFSPQNKTLYTDLTFKYSNTSYPQRTYSLSNQAFNNITTNTTLYLLSSGDGIYSAIQTAESSGATIQGVTLEVERQINNVWTLVGQQLTGSDGLATFWVNPNFEHRITATKTGYATAQVTITPSQSTYTLVMVRSSASATYNGSLQGMQWDITPSIGRLDIGTQQFGFNLTAELGNLDGSFCKMDIINSDTETVLATTTGGSAFGCNLSTSYAVTNDLKVRGIYYVDTTAASGFTIIDDDAYWVTLETNVRSWSTITSFLEELRDLPEFGTGIRQEYSRVVFFFFFLVLLTGIGTYLTGYDFSNPGMAMLLVYVPIMFASFAGWFNFENLTPYVWLNQYSVALIATFIVAGYVIGFIGRNS